MLIRFTDVHKSFGTKVVCRGVNLEIRRGETMTIMGGSGVGKSVILKMLIGLIPVDRGTIMFDGEELTKKTDRQLHDVRRRIAYLFQGAALFDSLSVGENIAYPLREQQPELTAQEVAERVAKNLEMVNLPGIEALRPSDLSGGMRKRVGLARAIAVEPEVILFDEPTTGLDPISVRIIDELILSLKQKLGSTQIVVTHDMESAFRVSDRIAMLSRRTIVEQGTVSQMKASRHPDVRAFFDARVA